ncbi:DUF3667 domain-containing protein [Kangiella sp. HZ709]|uniref:DUF3667 domain-containing protein n=1 Tax=Kangiella sp. HZ709 TaxID=2666328 RepID=UPI0012B03C93|nr:DUF3667 domain-containing protein [Kangiella sp. HZ709]MRX28193.1 DUF3667 domain-containing protein [Kangiella sp. HZ709]
MGKAIQPPERFTADKYCGQCGNKNFRPNRSLKELFSEFVEDWLGYDSKIYKTAAKLAKPAALSLDYFSNSHHKNHFITPIRLYLLLSIIFFLMTNFGGLSLTEIEFNDAHSSSSNQVAERDDKNNDFSDGFADGWNHSEAIKAAKLDGKELSKQTIEAAKQGSEMEGNVSITGDAQFNTKKGCLKKPEDFFNVWPKWLDKKLDNGSKELCDSYTAILRLDEPERQLAKRNWGLSLGQRAIEMIPQVFFLSLPILALVLGLFYFLSKRLYVEHLVLLMHSHSFIFGVVLLYLGWYQLTALWTPLGSIWMEELLSIGVLVYLYLSQKWFYKRGWWATLWRFLIFGFLYFILISIITTIGIMFGIVLAAN